MTHNKWSLSSSRQPEARRVINWQALPIVEGGGTAATDERFCADSNGDGALDIAEAITPLEAKRDKTKLIKQGMMQQMLTGKTRLV